MAAPPVLPADFDATKINANDNNCAVLTKSTQLTINAAALIRWMFNDDGSFTQDFLDAIGTGSTGLAAPTGLIASSDRTTDISISWGAVSGATSYSLYRSTLTTEESFSLVQSGLTTTSFIDTGIAQDVTFYYRVRAVNASQISPLSAYDDGKMPSSSSSSDPVTDTIFDGAKTVAVPTGKTQLEVWMWGPGGTGGHKQTGYLYPGVSPPAGGGGASGGFIRITGITVSFGQEYTFSVASSGSGKDTIVFLSTDDTKQARAKAGGNGSDADFGTGVAGVASPTYGANAFATGTVDAVNSHVGNNGSGSTPGTALSYGGLSAGAGGAGTNGLNTTLGQPGLIKYIFT